jgi:ribosomal protein L11 methylase PrmA
MLNGVASKIEFKVASIAKNTPSFDFVCANLTLDVILPILSLLLKKAKYLVLSGILKTQEPTISVELQKLNVKDFRIETAGDWIAVIINTTA